jgi:hypothetical protein
MCLTKLFKKKTQEVSPISTETASILTKKPYGFVPPKIFKDAYQNKGERMSEKEEQIKEGFVPPKPEVKGFVPPKPPVQPAQPSPKPSKK